MIEWIIPLGFILAGLFAGLIGEKVFFKKLKMFVSNRQIPGSEIIFQSLHRMTFIWFVIAGFFWAILSSPLKPDIANVLQKILTIILLYSVTLVLARLTSGFVSLSVRRTEGVPTSLLSNLAKIAVLILGTLILLQTVGIQITPIITTLGIGGLAVGLALQDTLANLFSGFYLLISQQVRTGDYVKLDDGNQGYVTDITWRNTTIKEISNNVIIVPNSKLASAIFTNYHLPAKEITLTINVGVSYDSDLELVERVTVEVAKEVMKEIAPELLQNEPYMRFHTFNDFSIDFTLYMRVSEFFDQRIGKHLFVKKLHKRYQLEGIQIPFPVRNVYMHES
ncbi:mechanosensitive ion channel family protein [Anabaena cylindrica FACHB-243]|uniref:MscS Mechanosensitive ion channel n=1 Tax=Anabaena cylindrica (strain ATCC 27899 / PCC 7122) TaxID=272123 RepID=K9ZID6_ANACC|nr:MULTISPECIES: mechanosensitive ion channel family protein [Anabaena]AFZ58993.1 MscS Mechanosensitive ion channel [Anabaena cylindrica PCC 7122]MBD2420663.1 mechanosensitive ion channel family protein [Anabaena cylindrica FACHB-243]MBY5281441.1 mechanosensitive ion channel family protein [Anabaena sp. CCAP 1446/1C]MBY5311094.1 mechanosensitive ion channel family protein [Anabaena sp. CCAP 1446/1C]MCM2409998.1 mechanosensitive ion channel family protein [Anabaena sp. CCAP 1446/1C]